MAVELRLCDADREEYGGPEWLLFDQDLLDDMRTEELTRLERAMNLSFYELRNVDLPLRTARGTKAACWLARQLAGDAELLDPTFADFHIHPLRVEAREPASDLLPPSDGSPDGATGETTPAEAS